MKRTIASRLFAATIFFAFAFSVSVLTATNNVAEVDASVGFAMIVTDDALFYSDASGRYPKFCLEKSYFVYVTEIVGELARVTYMDGYADSPALEGYVKTVNLSFYDKVIASPYPDVVIRSVTDAVIFSDGELSKPKSVVNASSSARYYGTFGSGTDKAYYVYCNGSVGYVKASAFESFTVGRHEDYSALLSAAEKSGEQTSASESISEKPEKEKSGVTDATKIIVIALLIVVGLTVLYFIVRPDRAGAKNKVYNDDE